MGFLHRDRAKQLIDFDSLSFGIFHPTDFDGVLEIDDNICIYYEFKYDGAVFPRGQRLCLERNANKWKQGVVIVADHYTNDVTLDVEAGLAIVRELFYKGKWWDYRGEGRTVYDITKQIVGEELEKKNKEFHERHN